VGVDPSVPQLFDIQTSRYLPKRLLLNLDQNDNKNGKTADDENLFELSATIVHAVTEVVQFVTQKRIKISKKKWNDMHVIIVARK
jgi:hypothetical protein